MKRYALIIALLLVVIVGACAKRYTRPPEKAEVPKEEVIKEEVIKPETEEVKEEEIAYAREEEVTEKEIPIEEIAKDVLRDIHFDFDKYNIRPDARPILDEIADFLIKHPDINIVIEGHCDERGTNEYNLALGDRRAKAAKDYLVSKGVSPSRILTITYGEERPLCRESNEECWQKNRRDHFVLMK